MQIGSYCPYCGKRRFLPDEGKTRWHIDARLKWKDIWSRIYGEYPLGQFYRYRCEICNRTLAVFDEHNLPGNIKGKPIVFFSCTLTDKPYNEIECSKHLFCHSCPIPKMQKKTNQRMYRDNIKKKEEHMRGRKGKD